MGMNKNTVLAWATFIMILMGLILIGLGAFRYDDVAGWGFATVGIVFSLLHGYLMPLKEECKYSFSFIFNFFYF